MKLKINKEMVKNITKGMKSKSGFKIYAGKRSFGTVSTLKELRGRLYELVNNQNYKKYNVENLDSNEKICVYDNEPIMQDSNVETNTENSVEEVKECVEQSVRVNQFMVTHNYSNKKRGCIMNMIWAIDMKEACEIAKNNYGMDIHSKYCNIQKTRISKFENRMVTVQ